ncbi:hypothetical protein [Anabaena sp. PCC 7108]|uniref:hypothetical protein n=1 Tax=Anabaena sp. PCC 7108 TaxID=163908 RepID=UPI000344DDDA|nr:hypothetical protein [Anabaena sp. PCC 7108]
MSVQQNLSNLIVELSAEEQQLLSGGCYQMPSCYQPKKCSEDYQQYDQPKPYNSCNKRFQSNSNYGD